MKLTCLVALFGLSSSLVISPPALPRAGMATRHRALLMQEEEDQSSKGISGALGGGKKTADIQKNPIAEAGSLVAFVIVISAIVFGGLNPDVVEGFAAKSAKCVDGTIVRGEKIQCELVNGIPTRVR